MLALTWDLSWDKGSERIGNRLAAGFTARKVSDLRIDTRARPSFRDDASGGLIEAFFTFESEAGSCRGHLRLRRDPEDTRAWKAWTVLTALQEITGHPESVRHHRPLGVLQPGEDWADNRRRHIDFVDREPRVVVIGSGHAGLGLAARLGRLGVDTLVLERNPRVGDNWRNRYRSLSLHNEVWMNDLPYLPFPESWPLFTPKDKLADWLEGYVSALDLNVWTGAHILSAGFAETQNSWTIAVRRSDGATRTVRPRHVVLATGVSGEPRDLHLRGVEDFGEKSSDPRTTRRIVTSGTSESS